jgi:hypothetical protein
MDPITNTKYDLSYHFDTYDLEIGVIKQDDPGYLDIIDRKIFDNDVPEIFDRLKNHKDVDSFISDRLSF